MSRPIKKPESERREIYERYLTFLANRPKKIMAEHGIDSKTMMAYIREQERKCSSL